MYSVALLLFGLAGAGTTYVGFRLLLSSPSGIAKIVFGLLFILWGITICIYSIALFIAKWKETKTVSSHPMIARIESYFIEEPIILIFATLLWMGILIPTVYVSGVPTSLPPPFPSPVTGGSPPRPSPTSDVSVDIEIKETEEAIQERVSSVKLDKSHLIFKDTEKPIEQFMLTINPKSENGKDAVYLFDKYKYVIEAAGDETKIPTAKLCDLIDAIYDRKDPILESLRDVKLNGKVSFPIWKGVSSEIEVGNLTPILVEILYAIRKFYEIRQTHPEIMIRGYADGQKSDWNRPLLDDDYHYEMFQVYPPTNPNSLNPNVFIKQESPISIPSNYKNEHLPDLRAFFVKKELVDPYLELCKNLKPESHILKGYDYKGLTDAPQERKVQIFILLYRNKSTQ